MAGRPDANRHLVACNGTIISDTESKGLGEVIQLQGDHQSKIKDFLINEDAGLGIDEKNIKVRLFLLVNWRRPTTSRPYANLYRHRRSTASKSGMSVVPPLSGLDS
jgi:hypothetical protein